MSAPAKAANRAGDFRKEVMTPKLASLTLSEDLLEAVHRARANGLSDYAIREQLLMYAGGPSGT